MAILLLTKKTVCVEQEDNCGEDPCLGPEVDLLLGRWKSNIDPLFVQNQYHFFDQEANDFPDQEVHILNKKKISFLSKKGMLLPTQEERHSSIKKDRVALV